MKQLYTIMQKIIIHDLDIQLENAQTAKSILPNFTY